MRRARWPLDRGKNTKQRPAAAQGQPGSKFGRKAGVRIKGGGSALSSRPKNNRGCPRGSWGLVKVRMFPSAESFTQEKPHKYSLIPLHQGQLPYPGGTAELKVLFGNSTWLFLHTMSLGPNVITQMDTNVRHPAYNAVDK